MVEPEIAFCDLEQLMEVEEQFVSHIVQKCLAECQPELQVLERDLTHLAKVTPPFPRIHYDEAVQMINAAAARGELVPGYPDPVPAIEWGDDFGSPHETYLAAQFEKPVFVHSPIQRGENCTISIPTTMATRSRVGPGRSSVTSKIPVMTSKAVANDSARKKIQAKHTRLNVASHARTGRSALGTGEGRRVPAARCAALRPLRQ